MLQFTRHSKAGSQPVAYASTQLVIAGWAARDEAAVKHHIEELAEIGVPPSSVPLFYRTAASLLTQSEHGGTGSRQQRRGRTRDRQHG
jgi:hypothetical protein